MWPCRYSPHKQAVIAMSIPSIEFWVIMQVAVDLCLIVLFLMVLRQMRGASTASGPAPVEDVTAAIESVLTEARDVASQFEVQLKEKQSIIRRLNERLDSRIIGLNLLLNRAEMYLNGKQTVPGQAGKYLDICGLQQEIITLAGKGLHPNVVADRLGISKTEVELVVELKKKFEEMEKH
jgi:hypothetical protein